MTSAHRPLRVSAFTALLVTLALSAGRGDAASTSKVVAISDAAPGGGVFAGPAFTTWPGAGGTGWVAFRTRLEGASASEALVLAGLVPPLSRVTVAQIGDSSPAGRKLRAFVGRPTVNANGDVAFLATLATSSADPADAPIPAALFLFRRTPPAGEPALIALAVSGDTIPAGVLDLAGDVDPLADATALDVPERGPVMNAAGTVALLAVVRSSTGAIVALCTATSGGVTPRARLGDPFRNGKIVRLGPPSLNGAGTLAFTATVDGPNGTTGVFTLGADGLVERVARGTEVDLDFDGAATEPQALIDFGDVVSIGDDGTLAFTAGPILDRSRDDTVGAAAAFAFAGGILHPVLYPGQRVRGNLDRVRGVLLGNAGAFATAPPVVTADGSVVAAASLNGGSVEAVLRAASPEYKNPDRLATTNGPTADASPAGGTYAGLESGPAVDAAGGVAFRVRVAGGYSSEAIIYRPGTGPAQGVFVGEGSPTDGFFAGAPFSTPRLNDRGDVVFRGYVANGPSSVGLFKASTTGLEALVRSGDPSPLGNSPFVDFPGDPSLNAGGTIAFTATVLDKGRGIFLIDRDGLLPLVRVGDAAPGPDGAVFASFGGSPSLSDAGDVAFRASIRYRNADGKDVTLEGLFLATGTSIRLLASAGQASPTGPPFLQMRDPLITAVPSLVFAAPVGTDAAEFTGVFAADGARVQTLVSERQILGAGITIDEISSAPAADAKGDIAFLASRRGPAGSLGPAILRRVGLALEVLLARGDTGPTGGVVKSLSQPTMNRTGHVAFRTSYQSGTGAGTGFLLANEGGLVPVLAVGEPMAGRRARRHPRRPRQPERG